MNLVLLALYALPPVGYALVYAVHSIKRSKIKAAIGIGSLSLLALCCLAWLAYAGL